MPGKSFNGGLGKNFEDKLMQTIEKKVEQKTQEAFDKASEAEYTFEVNNTQVTVAGKQVQEQLSKKLKQAVDGTEVKADVTIKPDAKVDTGAAKEAAKKTVAYLKDAVEGTVKPVEYVKKSDDKIYAAARELASKQESIFKEIAEQEIAMANKTSEETRKAYAEMAMASKEIFEKGASDFDVEEKINKTQTLIDELTAKLSDEKDPAVISSLNEQLDAAKIKMLALQDAFKNIKVPRNFYSTSDLESDVLERYSREHRENFRIGKRNNFSIASEDKEYWQTLTEGITTEKQLKEAINARKEKMIELNGQIDAAEEKQRKLYDLSSNTTGKEHDKYFQEWLDASDQTNKIVENYNEIRSELYNLIQLQDNWGKSIKDSAQINSEFMASEWREEEQAMNTIDDEILALAEARKAEGKAKQEQAQSSEENAEAQNKERQATQENTEAQREQQAVNEANNEAQDEAQQESRESADAAREEADAHNANADAIRNENEAKKEASFDTGNGIYKNQTGKVGDDSWGYTERVGYAQDALVRISHDKNGNMLVSETLKTNYKALENEILKVEKAIVDTQAKMDELSSKGIDTTKSQQNLDKLKTYLGELDNELDKYYTSPEYVPSTNQQASFATRRQETIEYRQNEKEQQKAIRDKQAYDKFLNDWNNAIIENMSRDKKAHDQFLNDWDNAIIENLKRDKQAYNALMKDWDAAIIENEKFDSNKRSSQWELSNAWKLAKEENRQFDENRKVTALQQVEKIYSDILDIERKITEAETKGGDRSRELSVLQESLKAKNLELFKASQVAKALDDQFSLEKKKAEMRSQNVKLAQAEDTATRKVAEAEEAAQKAAAKKEYDDRVSSYERIFYNSTGKLNEVEFAPNTEALRNSNALYDELETHIKKVYALKEASLKVDKDTLVGQDTIVKNDAEIESHKKRIAEILEEINAAEAVQESREEALLKLDNERDGILKDILNNQELQSRDKMQSDVNGWIEDVEKLQKSAKYTKEFQDRLDQVYEKLIAFKAGSDSIDEVNASFKELEQTMKDINSDKALSDFKKAQSVSISKLDLQITEFMRKNTRMGRQFREEFENLKLDWDTEHSLAEVQKLADEFAKLKARVTEADKLGAGFFDTLRQRAMGVNAQLIAQYLSWQDIIRYGRQAFEVIHDLDDALVDLKKTTAMSEKELNQFYYSSNKTAKEMGVSTKAIIEQSAAWSRLGYNTAETSEKMAALSSQFASISPGMTTEQAQTGLVSLMKAYKVNVDDVERKLMDNINVLGNKFAEDNLDIIEGMERAGATLSALGTSVQDSFALFTGAQEIIQNAETTGTALKTLSLRIRGFDEETEELSDDVIKATGKVADLTKVASNNYAGVSLWADAEQTRYRRLVDYLGDIASIWDEIGEKNKTQLLNNLFGKRGASVGSAILQNFDQVKEALAEMENAAGAADAEMEIIKQSISYKLNELKQTWVGILQEMIERGQINDLIDALIKLSENIGKVIEAIGPIPTLIAGWGLKELILNFEKVSDFSLKFIGDLYELGSTAQTAELFLGETADAANAVGIASGKSTNSVVKLGQALVALAKSPITWIAVAIGAAALAWDAFTDTVKETEEKIEKTKNKISEIEVEIKKLEELGDNRTKAEDVRLQQLRDELSLQERILKIEEKRKYAEIYGTKFSDLFDKDNYNAQIVSEYNKNSPESAVNRIGAYRSASSKIQSKSELKAQYEARLKELEAIDTAGMSASTRGTIEKEIDTVTLKIGKLSDEIERLEDDRTIIEGDLLSKIEDYQAIIDSTQELIDSGSLKGSTLSNAQQVIADSQQIIREIENAGVKVKTVATQTTNAVDSVTESVEGYNTAVKEISYAKLISNLEELGSKLDDVGTMMANVDEHGQFEIGDLDKIADYFAELEKSEQGVTYETEEVNKALKLLGEGTGTIEQNADAINTLADNYVRTSGVLKNLNEENKNLYIGRLKNMGIINAEAVVESELANAVENETQAKIVSVVQDSILVQYKQALADGNYEEANSIIAKIDALLKEQNANENTEKSVAFLVKAQEIFNNQDLDVNEKIKALEKLSESYLNTAEKAKYAAQMASLQAQSDQLEKDYAAGNGHGMDWRTYQNNKARIEADMEKLTNEAANNTAKVNYTKVQYNGGSKVKDKTGKDASSTIEALNNSMKKAADDAAKKSKESFKETIDYFERLIKVLDNSISMLEAHLEDVSGAFAKNTLLGAEEDLVQSKINSYSSAIDMYAKKAQQELAKIPADIAAKLQSGAVDLDDFIGEENRELVEAIKNYQTWADKVDEARLQLVQLKETLRQLELTKFNNIIKDFTDSINFRQTSGIDLIQKQMDLLSEAGQLIGESFYTRSIEQEKRILESLQNEQAALVRQLNEALNRGVEIGSDEWIEMANALTEVESKILDSKKAIEEFDNALLNLHTEVFEKIQNQFSSYIDELSNMKELIDDESKPVATADNKWTKEGLAQLGLLAQQYELSKYQVEQYNQEIELLNQQYLEGRFSTMEYMEKLQDLKSKQWEAVNASEAAKDAMRELNKARIEVVKEGINKEIDAYEKLIQAQKDALQAEKDLHDYRKIVADESKAIVNIERQLAAIADDQSASAIAKRKKLEQELHDARETLEETEYDHSISQQEDALDEQLKNYKETREAEIKTLEESLLNVEQLLEQTFEDIRANSQLIGETIVAQAQAHGIEMSQALTDAWFNGENSIAKYGDVLSSATSNFIGNIQGVESEVWELQNQANATSEGLASMFSTRADNLVQQLEGSWQSEANLNAMTNALHDSLSSTIDGSYSGTAVKTALDGITSSVDELADSAERARQSLLDLLRAKEESAEDQSGWIYEEDEDGNLRIVGKGKVKGKGVQNMGGRYYYATGAKRITHDQLAWTQENGPEMIVSPSDGAVLTPLSRGDSVLPTDQTANIWEWSKFNPTEFASKLIQSISGVGAGNVQTNTMQVGSLVTVNGNINDTMEMMQIAATQASAKIKQSFKEINKKLY